MARNICLNILSKYDNLKIWMISFDMLFYWQTGHIWVCIPCWGWLFHLFDFADSIFWQDARVYCRQNESVNILMRTWESLSNNFIWLYLIDWMMLYGVVFYHHNNRISVPTGWLYDKETMERCPRNTTFRSTSLPRRPKGEKRNK